MGGAASSPFRRRVYVRQNPVTDLPSRIAALRDKVKWMTKGEWIAVATMSRRHAASIAYENRRGAEFIMICGGPNDTDEDRDQRDYDAAGIVALRNDAMSIIESLSTEVERLRGEREGIVERCAKVCEGLLPTQAQMSDIEEHGFSFSRTTYWCAAAIRALTERPS